jgi:RNA polymerase sigma-70 factor (ECF subfamily)
MKLFHRDPLDDPGPLVERVYAYVAYRIGAGPDAEDVTSEAFERALRFRDSYDPARGSPAVWLIGIARRVLYDRVQAPVGPELPDVPSTEQLEDEAVRRLTLAEALRSLGDRDAELLALRYGGDLSARQIGELLGVRTNAVEVALHRALRRLRAELEPAERAASGPRQSLAPFAAKTAKPR